MSSETLSGVGEPESQTPNQAGKVEDVDVAWEMATYENPIRTKIQRLTEMGVDGNKIKEAFPKEEEITAEAEYMGMVYEAARNEVDSLLIHAAQNGRCFMTYDGFLRTNQGMGLNDLLSEKYPEQAVADAFPKFVYDVMQKALEILKERVGNNHDFIIESKMMNPERSTKKKETIWDMEIKVSYNDQNLQKLNETKSYERAAKEEEHREWKRSRK